MKRFSITVSLSIIFLLHSPVIMYGGSRLILPEHHMFTQRKLHLGNKEKKRPSVYAQHHAKITRVAKYSGRENKFETSAKILEEMMGNEKRIPKIVLENACGIAIIPGGIWGDDQIEHPFFLKR